MRALLLAAVSIVLVLLSAPSQAQDDPYPLPPGLQPFFETYMHKHNRGAFAVSVDGRAAGYSYCQVAGPCGRRDRIERRAIDSCMGVSEGVPCRLYAWRGTVVWEGPTFRPDGNALDKTAPPIPPEGPSQPAKLIKCRLPDGFVISMMPERCRSVGGEAAE
jgi:hypothetical protein